MTMFSKWITYTASYVFLSIYYLTVFIVENINNAYERSHHVKFSDIIAFQNKSQKFIVISSVIILVDFLIFDIVIRKAKRHERIRHKITENCTTGVVSYLLIYIISICTIQQDVSGIIANIFGYLFIGVYMIKSEQMYLCPSFLFLGYTLYKTNDGHFVLANCNREKYNTVMDDSSNGIESKNLSFDSHLVIIK